MVDGRSKLRSEADFCVAAHQRTVESDQLTDQHLNGLGFGGLGCGVEGRGGDQGSGELIVMLLEMG